MTRLFPDQNCRFISASLSCQRFLQNRRCFISAFQRLSCQHRLLSTHLALAFVATLMLASNALATITWSGGTNSVNPDQTLQDTDIVISGGINTVKGLAGPPAGTTSGGILQVNPGGGGMQFTGATVTLNSDASSPGTLKIQGPQGVQPAVSTNSSATTALIANGGNALAFGVLDLGSHTVLFNISSGTVPSGGPDLSVTAVMADGGLEKAGTGIISLSGPNTYTGGTMLDAGSFDINSSTAIGTGFFTINGSNTTIDNTSGSPITLANNNQFNLTNGDLTFTGSNDLNLGTGIMVMTNADRTVSITNSSATLTVGGRIQDAGQDRGLTKAGPGTLVLGGNSLYTGPTNISDGEVVLNGSLGNTPVEVGVDGTLINNGTMNNNVTVDGVLGGAGTINGNLTVDNTGLVDVLGGTITVNGNIVNNGLFVLGGGGLIAGGGSFTNNSTLDLQTAGATPPNLTNNGTIIDASVIKTKSIVKSGQTVTVKIDSYTGHMYQLQKASSPTFASPNNVATAKPGSTGTTLALTDMSATGTSSFYRIVVQ